MNTLNLRLHDKYFNEYKADILSSSSYLINYCNEHTQFDEYVYILLGDRNRVSFQKSYIYIETP